MDQTQKYSSLLAQRLGGDEVPALPAPQSTPKPQLEQTPVLTDTQTAVKAEDEASGMAEDTKQSPAPAALAEERAAEPDSATRDPALLKTDQPQDAQVGLTVHRFLTEPIRQLQGGSALATLAQVRS